jgi:hypothetical protein
MMADFFDLPPGVVAAVLLMLWPAIWAGALIITALWGDVIRQIRKTAPRPVHKAA